MAELNLSVEQLCGQLVVGGFIGTELTDSYREALARGERAGAILFRRNLSSLDQIAALNRAIIDAAPDQSPPFIGVDQEGGRVTRMPEPFLTLPAMRVLGSLDDLSLTRLSAELVASELAAVGINLNFAPVMDVDSNPDNPIIGDRALSRDPRAVAKHGVAFLRGQQQHHVLACAKHFPGHGDTALDSHLDLPCVDHDDARLRHVELPPFRAASGAGVASMMTAHVVYPALEADVPATFSRAICGSLLRNEIGFEGVLFSDDMEMGAIAKHHEIEHSAVEAVWAGCDVLLICKDEALQQRAHAALVARAKSDATFHKRCQQAAERSLKLRRLCPPRVESDAILAQTVGTARSRTLLERIDEGVLALGDTPPAPPSGDRVAQRDPTEADS